jgi:hypothetical protein
MERAPPGRLAGIEAPRRRATGGDVGGGYGPWRYHR